jgi:hypothetical protein
MQRAMAHPMSYLPRPLSQISFEHLNRFRLKNASFFAHPPKNDFLSHLNASFLMGLFTITLFNTCSFLVNYGMALRHDKAFVKC